MNEKKIGFFETWNEKAGKIENSLSRLQMAVMLVFTMVFTSLYHIAHPISLESITLVGVLIIGSFFPKMLKEIIEKRF
jgi:hypothetical protein